jgi:hypothetical protein
MLLITAGYFRLLEPPVKIDRWPPCFWTVELCGKSVSAELPQPMVSPVSNPQTVGVHDLAPAMLQTRFPAVGQLHLFAVTPPQVSGAAQSALVQQALFAMQALPHILNPLEHG